ncbi:MAG: replication factor C large subunit [Nanoarchaeota archaeon]|nr:replication factor C large subunit [Nanoarchaeota archaeon]MBU1975483.1 replication factor C large subunit [Nanoarchaeota archaeon]
MLKELPWPSKYKPKLSEFVSQKGVDQLVQALNNFKPGKAILLHGKQGTGKTSSVHAYAEQNDLEMIELNASDLRNADAINSLIGNAIKQQSLFSKSKIILVDEVDGIAGRQDRGGLPAIVKLIEQSTFPVVITANDTTDKKFSGLRKKSILIEFKPLDYMGIFEILKRICAAEKVAFEEDGLKMLARMADGDARAAINDLQSLSSSKITKEKVEEMSSRDTTDSIINALIRVFKTKKPEIALGAFNNLNEDIDKLFLWIEENLPKEYENPADLAKGMNVLAEADKFRGRIRRWQYYRFYVYIYDLLSVGVALAKDKKYGKMIDYTQSSRLLKIWIANQKNIKKKAICSKIAEKTHTSTRRAMQQFPFFMQMYKNNPKVFSEYVGLDKDQTTWMSSKI